MRNKHLSEKDLSRKDPCRLYRHQTKYQRQSWAEEFHDSATLSLRSRTTFSIENETNQKWLHNWNEPDRHRAPKVKKRPFPMQVPPCPLLLCKCPLPSPVLYTCAPCHPSGRAGTWRSNSNLAMSNGKKLKIEATCNRNCQPPKNGKILSQTKGDQRELGTTAGHQREPWICS